MPKMSQIPKATSGPADPDTHSLLDVLPEIRNAIWAELFKREQPILVHNARIYHAEALKRSIVRRDDDFKHNLNQSLSLLRTCRQFHHECDGILYGSNSFVLSRATDRCDHSWIKDYGCQYSQMIYVGEWLHNLGSQRRYLTSIALDIDVLCPLFCSKRLEEFSLLPLLQLLWHHDTSQCSVTFIRRGRVPSHFPPFPESADADRDHWVLKLNNILHALAKNDALRIKRYAPFDHALSGVQVRKRLDRGYVRFWNSQEDYFAECHAFEIADEGILIQWEERDDRHSFCDLSKTAQRKIYSYVAWQSSEIIVDLDKRTMSGYPMSLFQLNRKTRRDHSLGYAITGGVPNTLVATSSDIVTEFPSLSNLEEVLSVPRPHALHTLLGNAGTCDAKSRHKLTVNLRLRPSAPTLLAHVQIDMKTFIFLLRKSWLKSNITIRVDMAFPSGQGMHEESIEVPMKKLRRQLFLLLSDVLGSWFDRDPRGICRRNTIPTVVMNGRCEILSASYSGTSKIPAATVTNRHGDLSPGAIIQRGYCMAARRKLYEEVDIVRRKTQADSIYQLWLDLLRIGWRDVSDVDESE